MPRSSSLTSTSYSLARASRLEVLGSDAPRAGDASPARRSPFWGKKPPRNQKLRHKLVDATGGMWYTEPEIQEKGGITLGVMKMHHASGWMSTVSILTTLLLLALVAGGAILLYVLFKGAKDRRSRRDNEALSFILYTLCH